MFKNKQHYWPSKMILIPAPDNEDMLRKRQPYICITPWHMLGYPTCKMSKVLEQGRAGHPSEKGSELGMHLCHSNFNISTAVTCCCMHDAASVIGTHTSFVTANMTTKKLYPSSENAGHHRLSWIKGFTHTHAMLSHVLHTYTSPLNNAGHQVSIGQGSYRIYCHVDMQVSESNNQLLLYICNINIMMMLPLLLLLQW